MSVAAPTVEAQCYLVALTESFRILICIIKLPCLGATKSSRADPPKISIAISASCLTSQEANGVGISLAQLTLSHLSKQREDFYDAQVFCLNDDCWASFRIHGDVVCAHAHRGVDGSFLFSKSSHVGQTDISKAILKFSVRETSYTAPWLP